MTKKIIQFILIISMLSLLSFYAYSHSNMLDVSYDNCGVRTTLYSWGEGVIIEDNMNETWYSLVQAPFCYHIGDDVTTVTYYIFDENPETSYTWETDFSAEEAQIIKDACVESMKQWNDVYYYFYDQSENRVAKKIVNLVEGTESNCNIEIYPYTSIDASGEVEPENENRDYYEHIEYEDYIHHYHYNKWRIYIDVRSIYSNGLITSTGMRTGAHEIGHVLGLGDVDELCSEFDEMDHHEELLMGYGYGTRVTRPTYKDIAGVSITRGFHTDDDHIWILRDNLNDDGSHNSYDVICALCNGVKYGVDNDVIVNGTNYTYLGEEIELFGSCNGDHSIDGGNMLLVATDMVRDFYKCLHCRYIEEVEHSHHYTEWVKYDNTYHIEQCVCGAIGTHKALHAIRASEIVADRAPCIGCGGIVRIDPIGGIGQIIHNVPKVSTNGSYILPNGVIVLVDEDIEAYYNGTLVFYDKDNLSETE